MKNNPINSTASLPEGIKEFKEIDSFPKINISKGSHYLFSITGKLNTPLLAFKSSEDGIPVNQFYFKGKQIDVDKLQTLLESLEY